MSASVAEMRESGGKLANVRKEMSTMFKSVDKWEKTDLEKFESLEKEAADLHVLYKKWQGVEDAARNSKEELEALNKPTSGNPYGQLQAKRDMRSAGEQFFHSNAFKQYKAHGNSGDLDVLLDGFTHAEMKAGGLPSTEYKTAFSTSAGWAPFVERTGDVVPYARRRVMIPDLMPSVSTTMDSVKYMEETTQTQSSAATAENTALSESARAYTERTVNIEDIGCILPISERMFDDAPFVIGIINNSVGQEVDRAFETQLVSGTGTTPQLQGFLSTAAATAGVQTQAVGSDDAITAVLKAATLVQSVGFADPTDLILHPTNWQTIVSYREPGTGRFIFGDPSQAGPRTLWGYPVCVTTAMTLNSGLIGDFKMYAYTVDRAGLRVALGYVNDDWSKRLRTLRAYVRKSLVLRRPSAFCKITGLS
jgi:HK97 family phage major capsid protein